MEKILEIINNPIYNKILKTIIIIVVGYLIRKIIIKVIHKRIIDKKFFYKSKKFISYIYFTIITILLLMIWAEIGSMGTYLGLVSAGIAIALKDLFVSIAAWLFILTKKPFVVGDRIEIDDNAGDVIDQRLFQFTVMEIGNWVSSDQSTGRMIHIPNSLILSKPLFNFTSGFKYIWNEIDVLLTFESDYKSAKKMFLKLAEKNSLHLTNEIEKELKVASKQYMIYYNNLTPIVYTDVKDSGIMLSIRYLCIPQQRRNTNEIIWEGVLDIVNKNENINLAYNTIRMISEKKELKEEVNINRKQI